MFVRFVFLMLFALNLGAAAWLLFGRAPVRAMPPVTDPGVPALQLLSGRPSAPRAAATPAAGGTAAAPLSRDACHTLGAFTTSADMRAAMQTLSPHVARIQYREQDVSTLRGYWVYLPATTTREAALDEARKLSASGVTDYYVVTAGDAQNTVSLGLFDDAANARQRLADLKKAGFPAQMKQRIDVEPAYWIDYAVPAGSGFDWHAWLPGRSDLEARSIDCF